MNRLDVFVAEKYSISRSLAIKLIKQNQVRINNVTTNTPSKKVSIYDKLEISEESLLKDSSQTDVNILPQNIPIDIIYEDSNVVVINKQAGISVHTSQSEKKDTLINALVYNYPFLKSEFLNEGRLGIVHRLDKDTSGVLIVAKNLNSLTSLMKQFKQRDVYKEYVALTGGIIQKELIVDSPIGRSKINRKKMAIDTNGRASMTTFYPQKFYFKDKLHKYTLVKVVPKTGRTHQIRVHLKSIGHPIVGDKIYNGEPNENMFLHARKLVIILPGSKKMEFIANLPPYWDVFINNLNPYEKQDTK